MPPAHTVNVNTIRLLSIMGSDVWALYIALLTITVPLPYVGAATIP